MSDLHLRMMVRGYVRLVLKTKDYRIVSTEDFGDHWKVLVKCRDDSRAESSCRHLVAIGYDGRLIGDLVC